MDKNEDLARITKRLMHKEPFYGMFLVMLNKVWKDIGTAGVSINGINYQLAIDETFWSTLSDEFKLGIMKHELLHIAMHHLTMRSKYPNHRLFNIAADLEINQYIERNWLPGSQYASKEDYDEDIATKSQDLKDKLENNQITQEEYELAKKKLPIRGILFEDFKELNLNPKAGTDYYYKALYDDYDQQSQTSKSGCEAFEQLMQGSGDGHSTWNEVDDLSESEKNLLQKQAEHQLKETAEEVRKSRGTIPGELSELIDDLFKVEPPKFNWKKYLRQFIGGSEMSEFYTTRKRINKRFLGFPGRKVKARKHIFVAIDTSGSVSNEELVEFFNEIHHMHKTGSDVTICHADTSIKKIEKYNPKKKVEVHGRGGTDFNAAIDHYNENASKYTCMIYVTDGEAPKPDNKIKGKLLWVLSSISGDDYYKLSEYAPLIKLN